MMDGASRPKATPWDAVALEKLCSVLGREHGALVLAQVMEQMGLPSLETPDDLYRFAQHVAKLEGFTAAVGALLSLHAVMHGATGSTP